MLPLSCVVVLLCFSQKDKGSFDENRRRCDDGNDHHDDDEIHGSVVWAADNIVKPKPASSQTVV